MTMKLVLASGNRGKLAEMHAILAGLDIELVAQSELGIEDIEHTRTKVKHPQTNGICERFQKTVLNEFYRVAFRKKIYTQLEGIQVDLDRWLDEYNQVRPHQGRWCYGKTPWQTFLDAVPLAKEKTLSES